MNSLNENRTINSEEKSVLEKLISAFDENVDFSEGNCVTSYENGTLRLYDRNDETYYEASYREKDLHEVITKRVCSTKCDMEIMMVEDGDNLLTFARSYTKDETLNKPFIFDVEYKVAGIPVLSFNYCDSDRDAKNDCGMDYCIKVGVPENGRALADNQPRANRALYRIDNGNVNLVTEYLIQPHDEDSILVEGGCYQVFNKNIFDHSMRSQGTLRTPGTAFANLDFESTKSAILYTGNDSIDGAFRYYTLGITKTRNGIAVSYINATCYDAYTADNDKFTIPSLSSGEMNSAEIESVIDELQRRYQNDDFISIIISELNKFNAEVKAKKEKYPVLASSPLSAMRIKERSFNEILNEIGSFFEEADRQFTIMTNSDEYTSEK